MVELEATIQLPCKIVIDDSETITIKIQENFFNQKLILSE
jgi:hypothetical protein